MQKTINILGTGIMGSQIISLFYIMGYKINIFYNKNSNEKLIHKNIKILNRYFNNNSSGILEYYNDINKIENYFTIETISEDYNSKINIFNLLLKKNITNIFSNTSSLNVKKLSKNIELLHFMNPIFLKVFEFTDSNKIFKSSYVFKDLLKLNFNSIELKNTNNFGINKIIFAEISEFFRMLENDEINVKDLNSVYFKVKNIDIINVVDKIGIDICLQILKNLSIANNNIYIPNSFTEALSNNILGKKNNTSIKSIVYK